MNQPLGRVTLDAARAVLASARLAREDFMANKFCRGKTMMASCSGFYSFYIVRLALRSAFSRTNSTMFDGSKGTS